MKDPSLQSWILSNYKKLLRKSSSSKALSDIRSALERIFEPFAKITGVEGSQIDSDVDDSDSSKFINQSYLVSRISNQHETSSELSGLSSNLRDRSGSCDDACGDKVSGQYLKPRSGSQESGGARPMDFVMGEHGEMSHGRSSVPRDLMNHQMHSPAARNQLDFRTNSFDSRNHNVIIDKNQVTNMDFGSPSMRSSSGGASNSFASPKHHLVVPHTSTTTQMLWYFDGEPAAMDIFPASKQLWVGFLGADASEAHVRFQFERFGPIELYIFFPMKGFAIVEYRNVLDSIKAREYIRRHFRWRIKFMDVGFGTRGAMNGVAVGSSCHVYVGNISSQWAKDEILHESRRVLYKGPYMVTDLSNEGALLIEFESPEDAAVVMAHLRQHRKERSNYQQPFNVGTTNVAMSHIDGARSMPTPTHVDVRSNLGNSSNNSIRSSHAKVAPENPMESSRGRVSHLTSLLSSLRSKYNINQNSSCFDNYISGTCHASTLREEDRKPTSTLWISIPNISSPCLADDELMAVCNLAFGNMGSVVRLRRAHTQFGCGWYVDCSSVDAAINLLKNLRGCPGMFFQIEFRFDLFSSCLVIVHFNLICFVVWLRAQPLFFFLSSIVPTSNCLIAMSLAIRSIISIMFSWIYSIQFVEEDFGMLMHFLHLCCHVQ